MRLAVLDVGSTSVHQLLVVLCRETVALAHPRLTSAAGRSDG